MSLKQKKLNKSQKEEHSTYGLSNTRNASTKGYN